MPLNFWKVRAACLLFCQKPNICFKSSTVYVRVSSLPSDCCVCQQVPIIVWLYRGNDIHVLNERISLVYFTALHLSQALQYTKTEIVISAWELMQAVFNGCNAWQTFSKYKLCCF